ARTSGDAGGGESLTSMAIIAPTSMLTESGVAASVGASSTILHGTVFEPALPAMTAPLDGAEMVSVCGRGGSQRLSCARGMAMVFCVSLALKDSVPLALPVDQLSETDALRLPLRTIVALNVPADSKT